MNMDWEETNPLEAFQEFITLVEFCLETQNIPRKLTTTR